MLLQTDNMNETISTLEAETIGFTVDPEALDHIMSVLTNLYSDPISSVVREITTNALDSHLISGQTKPVEIYSPNRLSQNLVIQDFGAGLSANDIRKIYSSYGSSTKRGNNIEAGQLGLGSKSPFAYTDQFTIVAVKDGEKTTAIMGRNSGGSAEINIVSVSSTTDPNGVKMTIPVKSNDIHAFQRAINDFAKYADPDLILVDSQKSTAREGWIDLGDGVYIAREYQQNKVVMGNVAYPIGRVDWTNELSVIYYCEMGDVTFAPSREELIYNDKTQVKVDWIKNLAYAKVADYIREKAAKAASTYEKFHVVQNYSRWVTNSGLLFSGMNQQSTIFRIVGLPRYADSSASSNEMSYQTLIRYERKIIVMRNFVSQRWTKLHTNKVLEKDDSLTSHTVVLYDGSDDQIKDLFGNDVKIADWDDFRSVKVERKRADRKPKFSYEGFSRRELNGITDIRTYENVLYISKTNYNSTFFNAQHLKKNECVVFVPRSSQEDFIARFNAKSFVDVCTERQAHIRRCIEGPKLQKQLRNVICTDYDMIHMLTCKDGITNKEFIKDAEGVAKYYKWKRIANRWRVSTMPTPPNSQKKYLLLNNSSAVSELSREHLMIYINALEEK